MARHRRPDPDHTELDSWDLETPSISSAPADPRPLYGRIAAHEPRWDQRSADSTEPVATRAAPFIPKKVVYPGFAAEGSVSAPHDPTPDPVQQVPIRGAHRKRVPVRPGGRAMVMSVAAGALLAAGTSSAHASPAPGHSQVDTPPTPLDTAAGLLATAPQVLQIPEVPTLEEFADQLQSARDREAARAAREAAARRPLSFSPVSGTLTSNYGPRWGSTHYGLDIANTIGTPIFSVTDGTVIEAGPASGFGLWVRILQDDGTIGVFGHINEALVSAGQKVRAGDVIATVGNRGFSTGPHLHYEVWEPDGTKADPMAWLNARGVQVATEPAARG